MFASCILSLVGQNWWINGLKRGIQRKEIHKLVTRFSLHFFKFVLATCRNQLFLEPLFVGGFVGVAILGSLTRGQKAADFIVLCYVWCLSVRPEYKTWKKKSELYKEWKKGKMSTATSTDEQIGEPTPAAEGQGEPSPKGFFLLFFQFFFFYFDFPLSFCGCEEHQLFLSFHVSIKLFFSNLHM